MKYIMGCLIFFILTACNSGKIVRSIHQLEDDYQHHTGFVLYDPGKGTYLIEQNADKYFTPASNTKIITLYTALSILGDTLPALYYHTSGDSLIFWGTGSPEFLYAKLPQSDVYSFLRQSDKSLYFSAQNFYDDRYGEGWSWDDYLYSYSAEKSPLPLYANTLTINKEKGKSALHLDIPYFHRRISLSDSLKKAQITRPLGSNIIVYNPALTEDLLLKKELPFYVTGQLTANLLSDTLSKPVEFIQKALPPHYRTFPGIATSQVYREMMQDSDNFIAEQLLLVCAGQLSDSLKTNLTIKWAQESILSEAPDPIVWKDGSGLSRYNLITPRATVWLWDRIIKLTGQDQLFSLLATGGKSGTLKNYYQSDNPYIYGKTGTLSNNHNLSGFLITKKNRVLIFSFMNNNFPSESRPIKRRMEKILWDIHERY